MEIKDFGKCVSIVSECCNTFLSTSRIQVYEYTSKSGMFDEYIKNFTGAMFDIQINIESQSIIPLSVLRRAKESITELDSVFSELAETRELYEKQMAAFTDYEQPKTKELFYECLEGIADIIDAMISVF